MRTLVAVLVTLAAAGTAGCGATRSDNATRATVAPTLTAATVTFQNREHGKDADSAVTIELLRNNAELAAESKLVGTKYDDNSASGPLALSITSPLRKTDIDDARLRIRMNPDGKDDWTFDMQLALTFSDGSVQRFASSGLRLDNNSPERTVPLGPARLP